MRHCLCRWSVRLRTALSRKTDNLRNGRLTAACNGARLCFRVAPKLADHPQVAVVTSDPYGPESQRIVTELVLSEHRHAGDLKESLKDGQGQPGVITREGALINANTRCVLMRELAAEGDLRAQAIRVAVLPSDVLDPELLDLEACSRSRKSTGTRTLEIT